MIEIFSTLELAINGWVRKRKHTVCQDRCVAALQQHAQLPPQPPPEKLKYGKPRLGEARCI